MQVMASSWNVVLLNNSLNVLHVEKVEDKKGKDSIYREPQFEEDQETVQELRTQGLASAHLERANNPAPERNLERHEPNAQITWPIRPSFGPPLRLMMSEPPNPCTISFEFPSGGEEDQFYKEFHQYNSKGGEHANKRILLFGRWATDPKKRPKVTLYTFGQPPEIWWEDEEGHVVEGPVFTSLEDRKMNRRPRLRHLLRRIRAMIT